MGQRRSAGVRQADAGCLQRAAPPAQQYLRHERADHTLPATALVHEAYLRLVDQHGVAWQNRAHFFGVAAQLMRRILVDYARRRQAAKRGGAALKVTLNELMLAAEERAEAVVALDDALERLTAMDPRQGRAVELRVFSGLTVEETAEVLGISPATVKREWTMARAVTLHRGVMLSTGATSVGSPSDQRGVP